MKRRLFMLAVLVLVVTFSVGYSQMASARTFLSMAGGPSSGSTLQDTSAALAGFLNQEFAYRGINITPEGSPGGADNVIRVNLGELDMSTAFSVDMIEGFSGTGFFEGNQLPNIRGVAMLCRSIAHAATLEGSGITSVADFAGRRIAIGGPGSSTTIMNERFLRMYGIWDYITPLFLSGGDQMAAIRDGHADASIWTTGVPGAMFVDLSTDRNMVLIDLATPGKEMGFFDEFAAYIPFVIPGGSYRGVDNDVPTIQATVLWIAHKDMDPDLIYDFLTAAFSEEGLTHLGYANAMLRDMSVENGLEGLRIPLHTGAERFWQGQDIYIPEDVRAID